jgi:hypothetical protein
MPYQFVKWLWAVMNHWEVFVTGGIITAILEAWNRLGPAQYEFPRKWYVVLVLLYIFFAAFLAWRDEYVRAQHVSDQVAELAAMQDDFYSRMNDWWTICEDKEKSQAAEVAAEAVRKKIYDKLASINIVEANYFNTQRADERLPEAITLKSSRCVAPGRISVYWHRLDRLGAIILRLRADSG